MAAGALEGGEENRLQATPDVASLMKWGWILM